LQRELHETFQRYGFKAGFLKLTLLKLLSRGPTHGYALMKEIEHLTEDDWKPSPGSIYPALQELVADGLVSSRSEGRRKIYDITPKGQDALTAALASADEALKNLSRLLSL
jgi:DNA-binding PadR family transcriptional regulator